MLKLRLQFHSEPDDSGAPNDGGAAKTFTQAEVDAMLQSEVDRRITMAQKKWEEKTKNQLTEAEKLAKMSSEEKYKYELEQKEGLLATKEKELNKRLNQIEALKVMEQKGISASLVDFIVSDDADTTMNNIKLFDKAIKDMVNKEIKNRLGQNGIPKTGTEVNKQITQAEFMKMSMAEKMEIFNNDIELYNKLMNK